MAADLREYLPILAMAGVLAVCGWLVAGDAGVVAVLGAVALATVVMPRLPAEAVMRMFNARPLSAYDAPEVYTLVHRLARIAGLALPPALYRFGGSLPNAVSAGDREAGAIAISDRLFDILGPSELAGVLAHEVAHLAADDSGRMRFAEVLGRLTRAVANVGLLLAVLSILFDPATRVPFWVLWFLALAPIAVTLLQLALAREREFAADAAAVRLTADPDGLARALVRIETATRWTLTRTLGRFAGIEAPNWLRTHPATRERIARLSTMRGSR